MKRVLIIDPSETFSQFIKIILVRLGYEVTYEKNAEKALPNLASEMPDMILSEAKLPGIGGIELCERLKKEPGLAHILIAILSTDGAIETIQRAQKAGCIDFVTKPVTSRALYQLMEKHLPYHYRRKNIRANMSITALVNDGRTSTEMETMNIGEGGLYLCTDQPSPVGAQLTINLPLPGLIAPLNLQGEVLYINTVQKYGIMSGAGVKFVGMDGNTGTLLAHYMMTYLSNFLPESPQGE